MSSDNNEQIKDLFNKYGNINYSPKCNQCKLQKHKSQIIDVMLDMIKEIETLNGQFTHNTLRARSVLSKIN